MSKLSWSINVELRRYLTCHELLDVDSVLAQVIIEVDFFRFFSCLVDKVRLDLLTLVTP